MDAGVEKVNAIKADLNALTDKKADLEFELKDAKEKLKPVWDELRKLQACGAQYLGDTLRMQEAAQAADPGQYGEPFWLGTEDRATYSEPLYSGSGSCPLVAIFGR